MTYRPKDVSKSHRQEVSAISDPQDMSRQVQEEEVNSDFEVAVYRPKLEEGPQSDSLNITLIKGNQTQHESQEMIGIQSNQGNTKVEVAPIND